MAITAAMVQELRKLTDAPMMECKKALNETGGDLQKAVDYLRTRGVAKAAKRATKEANEGRVGSYIHTNGKVGVMLELGCETDFCANNDDFQGAIRDICMHIAAADPEPVGINPEDIPAEAVEAERRISEEKAREQGKPENIIPKIIEGQIDKFVKDRTLLQQEFVKNPDITVGTLITDLVGKLGENIVVRRFQKFKIGE